MNTFNHSMEEYRRGIRGGICRFMKKFFISRLFGHGKTEQIACTDTKVPEHIAFIMDGNGRWAKKRSMPREYGHKVGAEVFRKIVTHCGDIGVNHITFYAFSTENWKRPKSEVDSIMELLESYVDTAFTDIVREHVRVVFIGSKDPFSTVLREKMEKLERDSAQYTRILNIAVNYGGRDEIVHACNELIRGGETSVTKEMIAEKLYTYLSPDPDLIIRTAGERRLSNFLMWQSAYSEFYFTDKLWPDMTGNDVDAAIEEFAHRERRYGGL